jgi:hypothetical protein
MSSFEFERPQCDFSDRAFVKVDNKYSVVIIRTEEGLIVDVYGKELQSPVATTWVHDNDVPEAEAEVASTLKDP